ncbi:Antizyme inhibitor 2 [Galdieria sulphuraria]|uniref:ornithine decarboxylase n=1 Tax=Galdieria sulphuraria TaxID=130081 RepID=M2WSS2_GALSU|nr:ornithine decarboxylase [Galdieria sulphuraria]EME26910.1 ornithine decarboxylase [Galdieria sulphuraria]GJD10624.1 Antizyme inhibitor 2 [Galdieria sulphuraria]|eukprot:XP_005703430.1 ornithine decarboxylase [Galdieria sulphuraria]
MTLESQQCYSHSSVSCQFEALPSAVSEVDEDCKVQNQVSQVRDDSHWFENYSCSVLSRTFSESVNSEDTLSIELRQDKQRENLSADLERSVVEESHKSSSGYSVVKPSCCKMVESLLKNLPSKVYRVPSGTDLEWIASKFIHRGEEQAFYVIDIGAVEKKYLEFVRQLPRVHPYFAVKCNPDPVIVRLLAALGCNFDCASKSEIKLVSASGVSGDRVIYANPCKPQHHLSYAVEKGVTLVTFDNRDELYKLRQLGSHVRAILRIATEDEDSLCPLSSKFGAFMEEVPSLLSIAQTLNVRVVGVAFHVGSGCRCVKSYISSIENARRVFDIAESMGLPPMTILDIGGGFPGFDGESSITFEEIAKGIRGHLDKLFPEEQQVEIIAEPGRYFVGSSHTLMTRVNGRRHRLRGDEAGSREDCVDYYIDDGVYGSFRDVLTLGITFYPNCFPHCSNRRILKSTIFGPTCDSIDCIIRDYPLRELDVGDWIYFKDMGAYTISLASSFNGFHKPSCKYIYGM